MTKQPLRCVSAQAVSLAGAALLVCVLLVNVSSPRVLHSLAVAQFAREIEGYTRVPPPPPPHPHSLLNSPFSPGETRAQTARALIGLLNTRHYAHNVDSFARQPQKPLVFLKTFSTPAATFSSLLSRLAAIKRLNAALFFPVPKEIDQLPNEYLPSTKVTWNFAADSQRCQLADMMLKNGPASSTRVTVWDAYSLYDPTFYAEHLIDNQGALTPRELDNIFVGIARDPAERIVEAVDEFKCTETGKFSEQVQQLAQTTDRNTTDEPKHASILWDGREESLSASAVILMHAAQKWRHHSWQCEFDATSKTVAGAAVPGMAMRSAEESAKMISKMKMAVSRMETDELFMLVAERMLESVMVVASAFDLHLLDMAFAMSPKEKRGESAQLNISQTAWLLREAQPLDSFLYKKANSVLNRRLKELYPTSQKLKGAMKNFRIMNENLESTCEWVLQTRPQGSGSLSPTIWQWCGEFMVLDKQTWNDRHLGDFHGLGQDYHKDKPEDGDYVLYVANKR